MVIKIKEKMLKKKTKIKNLLLATLVCSLSLFGSFSDNSANAAAHQAGTNVKNNGVIYFDDGTSLRPYTSAGAFLSYKYNSWSSVQQASIEDLALPVGSAVPPRDGSLIRDRGTVYLITKGQRAGSVSAAVFIGLGYKWANVISGDTSFLNTLPPINSSAIAHPADTLVNDSGTIFISSSVGRIGVPDPTVLASWGYSLSEVVSANSYDQSIQKSSYVLGLRPATELSAFQYLLKAGTSPTSGSSSNTTNPNSQTADNTTGPGSTGSNPTNVAAPTNTLRIRDTVPPTVAITAPTNSAAVSGIVTISAQASDNVAVANVQFQIDGVNFGLPVKTAPYQIGWDTTQSTNGTHTIAAIAKDTSNNTARSTAVSVTVSNNSTPPPSSGSAQIGIDANSAVDQASPVSSITSNAFSTTASNELLLALLAVDGPTSTNSVSSVTGAGVTWVLAKRTNTQFGSAEIWRAFAGAPLNNVQVTANFAQSGNASMVIMSFTNTGVLNGGSNGSGGIGASASGSAASGAPSVSLTTTQNNSLVLGVGHDWDASISRSLGPNQTLIHQTFGSGGSTSWTQRYNGLVPAAGTAIILNDSAPTTDKYNFSAVEIIPASGTANPPPTADTTPPTVAITVPTNGSSQSGTINITANAADNIAVAGVTFKVDGNIIGSEVIAAPYTVSLNTAALTNGVHVLTATARDTSNNTATSVPINITVSNTTTTLDTTAPTVNLISPASGSSLSGVVTIAATASDPDDQVASVQFKVDGNNIGALDTVVPFQISWDTTTVTNGSHSITATATDSHGNSATSAIINVNVSNSTSGGGSATGQWYVRTDGGTAAQCTGKTNAPYPGSGTNQACAFSNPHYLWGNDVSGETAKWKIAGGDTVIIANGSYRIGYKGPNSTDSWGQCPGDPYDCGMPPIPSGTPSQHTKILGQNFSACSSMPELHGGYGLFEVINLSGSQYVDLGCMEITDHAACGRIGTANNCSSSFPLDDYATHGIMTSAATGNITLTDLNIHGLANDGINGPVGSGGLTATRVRIAGNTGAGWNFDDGNGTKTTGTVQMSGVTVEWNGCSEKYPLIGTYDNCFDDNSGGYGDGVGTPDTGGTWLIDHSIFRYNTQDGLDLLHVDNAGAVITETANTAYGNMGNQMKEGAATATFQNNVVIGNCKRLQSAFGSNPSSYNTHLSDFCRANGDAVVIGTNDNAHGVIQNNSVTSNYSIAFDLQCLAAGGGTGSCTTASHINFDNNLVYGFPDISGQHSFITAIYEQTNSSDFLANPGGSRKNNLLFHTNNTCAAAPAVAEVCADPLLTSESDINTMDFHLTSASPAKDQGLTAPSVISDFDGVSRPQGAAYDIGAYEFH